jgi:hypothetical protein
MLVKYNDIGEFLGDFRSNLRYFQADKSFKGMPYHPQGCFKIVLYFDDPHYDIEGRLIEASNEAEYQAWRKLIEKDHKQYLKENR